jgi:dipeptidyl aminopeptidase/acylaminoacyl peptidase
MADSLQQRGLETELHLIPGEGHGFRDSGVRSAVLEATEAFFRRQFHL